MRGKVAFHCKVYRDTAVMCAKTAEPIEMPFGFWARMGARNRVRWGPQFDLRYVTNWRSIDRIVAYCMT